MFDFYWSSLCTADILSMLSYVTWYFLIKFLRAIMLVIEYLLNHTSCLHSGTIALWVTSRLRTLPFAVIFFLAWVIFSTGYKFQNRSIVGQFYININFLISNFISLVWFCLNQKNNNFSNICLNTKLLFGSTHLVWCTSWYQYVYSNCKCDFFDFIIWIR